MKKTLLIPAILVLLAGAYAMARQSPPPDPANPCNESASADSKKKEPVDHDPLIDPAEEMRLRAQKKFEEKNFKELQDSATQLAALSGKMSMEIDRGGQYVISIRVLDELAQIEKLTTKVRSLSR
jgi:hypothetical protein